jgi:hypothetical protein
MSILFWHLSSSFSLNYIPDAMSWLNDTRKSFINAYESELKENYLYFFPVYSTVKSISIEGEFEVV